MNEFVTDHYITAITVSILGGTISCILYITIYILISYKDYKGGCTPRFLIVTTVTVTLGLRLVAINSSPAPIKRGSLPGANEEFIELHNQTYC